MGHLRKYLDNLGTYNITDEAERRASNIKHRCSININSYGDYVSSAIYSTVCLFPHLNTSILHAQTMASSWNQIDSNDYTKECFRKELFPQIWYPPHILSIHALPCLDWTGNRFSTVGPLRSLPKVGTRTVVKKYNYGMEQLRV